MVMSQSSHLPWELVKMILWEGHYLPLLTLGHYVLWLIIYPIIYFHPLQMTLRSLAPLPLYNLHMKILKLNSMW